jgi:hypothetical protein
MAMGGFGLPKTDIGARYRPTNGPQLMDLQSIHPHSLAIGQTIILDYFDRLSKQPDTAIDFYGETSSLVWDGSEFNGVSEIREALKDKQMHYQIGSATVQTVPNTTLWTLLIVTGTYDDGPRFHASFYLEGEIETHRAVIRHQNFETL